MKLTKTRCDAATYTGDAERKERVVLWDDEIPGFGLRVYPSGSKSWILSYRAGSRRRLLTIGSYSVLKTKDARDKARTHLARIQTENADPVRERHERLHAESMNDLWEIYKARHLHRKKPRSQEEDLRNYANHVEPRIGTLQVSELTRHDVLRLHHSMKTTPTAANRVLALLSKLCSLALEWGVRTGDNPCRHVKQYREIARKRYLSLVEVGRIAAALQKVETKLNAPSVAALRLLMLTGCRKSEVLTLKWSDVDLEGGRFELQDSKAGRRTVYLAAPAAQLLAELPRRKSATFVFPGRGENGHLRYLRTTWHKVRDAAKLDAPTTIHDLRHTYASFAASGSYSLPMIGQLLGHSNTATTERYAHLADDPVRAAAEAVGQAIDAAMAGESADIVPFRR